MNLKKSHRQFYHEFIVSNNWRFLSRDELYKMVLAIFSNKNQEILHNYFYYHSNHSRKIKYKMNSRVSSEMNDICNNLASLLFNCQYDFDKYEYINKTIVNRGQLKLLIIYCKIYKMILKPNDHIYHSIFKLIALLY